MTNTAFQRDVGAFLTSKIALTPRTLNAGTTTEDGIEQNGSNIDRKSMTSFPHLSCKVLVPYSFTAIATNTGSLKANLQDSTATSAGWADYNDKDGSTATTVTLGSTASTAAQTTDDVLAMDFDLSKAKQYIRVQVTGTLSGTSTGTDDLDVGGVTVFGGANLNPSA